MNFTPRPAYSREGAKVATEGKTRQVPEAGWIVLEKISYFTLSVFEIRTVESVDSRCIPSTISCLPFLLIRLS